VLITNGQTLFLIYNGSGPLLRIKLIFCLTASDCCAEYRNRVFKIAASSPIYGLEDRREEELSVISLIALHASSYSD